jgi:predicted metal-dependent hydrolase
MSPTTNTVRPVRNSGTSSKGRNSPIARSPEPSAAASSAEIKRQMPGSDAVPTRPMDFDAWIADLPKYFAADGDIVMSHVLAVLSSVFPDGEDFFVRSVRAAAGEITDPKLAKDVEGFIGQESMHGREHRVLNDKLAELGYPTHEIGHYVRVVTALRERVQSKKANLAFTAALEHYTASLAENLLGHEEARQEIGHPGFRYLLIWHALEESEHKAVAFDVFRTVGGSELMRQVTMWLTHMTFILETGTWAAISLARDPHARRHPVQVAKSILRLRRSPFTTKEATRQLFQYHKIGFHPDDRDTTELIATWRDNLFGAEGELVEVLAKA